MNRLMLSDHRIEGVGGSNLCRFAAKNRSRLVVFTVSKLEGGAIGMSTSLRIRPVFNGQEDIFLSHPSKGAGRVALPPAHQPVPKHGRSHLKNIQPAPPIGAQPESRSMNDLNHRASALHCPATLPERIAV